MTISKNPKLLKKLKEREFVETELCEAHKLLLKRMSSNPDEFHLVKGGMWADYLNLLHQRVTQNDKNTLVMIEDNEIQFVWNKYKEVAKENLHKNFMQRILIKGEPVEGGD